MEFCKENNLDYAPAIAFDKSLAITNNFQEKGSFDLSSANIYVNKNENIRQFSLELLAGKISDLISYASRYFTFKIGDLFYVKLEDLGEIKESDNFVVSLNDLELLKCRVR